MKPYSITLKGAGNVGNNSVFPNTESFTQNYKKRKQVCVCVALLELWSMCGLQNHISSTSLHNYDPENEGGSVWFLWSVMCSELTSSREWRTSTAAVQRPFQSGFILSLVPGVHERRKERLVSAVCACVKLTIFIAPLFCIMTQPHTHTHSHMHILNSYTLNCDDILLTHAHSFIPQSQLCVLTDTCTFRHPTVTTLCTC